MGLSFGWKAHDLRDTIWKDDTSLQNVPAGSLEDWAKDGDASHLRAFATNGTPEVFTYRALTMDERTYAIGVYDQTASGFARLKLLCFRIGVEFPGASEEFDRASTGQRGLRKFERVHGIRMLAEPFVSFLNAQYPDMIEFYGDLIFAGTYASEQEKKA